MTDATLAKIDCILEWKLDRRGRSVSNCMSSIDEPTRLGVRLIYISKAGN
jgi:DNA invertase Pin-like site-specific DNA recombinase